jgi:hypothetical protein
MQFKQCLLIAINREISTIQVHTIFVYLFWDNIYGFKNNASGE